MPITRRIQLTSMRKKLRMVKSQISQPYRVLQHVEFCCSPKFAAPHLHVREKKKKYTLKFSLACQSREEIEKVDVSKLLTTRVC